MADARLSIEVNGEARELPAGTTVAGLLSLLELSETLVAVEVNEEIVRRKAHATHALEDGDAVEIVQFVGGG